jgi:hypothetical protein
MHKRQNVCKCVYYDHGAKIKIFLKNKIFFDLKKNSMGIYPISNFNRSKTTKKVNAPKVDILCIRKKVIPLLNKELINIC